MVPHCLKAGLNIKSDVAGATLLSWVTSSPELFTNIIGIFIMKGDMGVGKDFNESINFMALIHGHCFTLNINLMLCIAL